MTKVLFREGAVLIVNTHSRSGKKLYKLASRLLKSNKSYASSLINKGHNKSISEKSYIKLAESYAVKDPMRLPIIVQTAILRGYKTIIIGGGDGTISSVAGFFAFKDVTLAILPLLLWGF